MSTPRYIPGQDGNLEEPRQFRVPLHIFKHVQVGVESHLDGCFGSISRFSISNTSEEFRDDVQRWHERGVTEQPWLVSHPGGTRKHDECVKQEVLEFQCILKILMGKCLGHGSGAEPVGASLVNDTGGCEMPENASCTVLNGQLTDNEGSYEWTHKVKQLQHQFSQPIHSLWWPGLPPR